MRQSINAPKVQYGVKRTRLAVWVVCFAIGRAICDAFMSPRPNHTAVSPPPWPGLEAHSHPPYRYLRGRKCSDRPE
jgi:hypothetical protein